MSDDFDGRVVWSGSAGVVKPFHVRSGFVFLGAFRRRGQAIRKAKRSLKDGWANVRVLDVRLSSSATEEAPHD